jgi:hypothetical protein
VLDSDQYARAVIDDTAKHQSGPRPKAFGRKATVITLWKVGSELMTRSGRRIRPQHRGNLWYQLDLNIERDRAYLMGRGFAFAVIAGGNRRGKVVSAHRTRALAELAAKAFGGKNSPEIVEIATFA